MTTEPRDLKLASGVTMRLAFIEGPEGVTDRARSTMKCKQEIKRLGGIFFWKILPALLSLLISCFSFWVPDHTNRTLRTPLAVTKTRSVPEPSSSDSTKKPALSRE